MPAALAHKTEHHAQPKASAVAFALGGEEGFECALEGCLGHAHAGVGHCQAHVFAGLDAFTDAIVRVEDDVFPGDTDHALALHGIPGIDRQVEQRIFQLVAVDIDAPGILGQLHVDMNGFPQRPLQQLAQAGVDALRVVHRRRQGLATGKGQQLRGQLGPTFHGGDGRGDATLHLGVVRFMPGKQMQVASDHLQQVIEVMGHATGQAANRFQFL